MNDAEFEWNIEMTWTRDWHKMNMDVQLNSPAARDYYAEQVTDINAWFIKYYANK